MLVNDLFFLKVQSSLFYIVCSLGLLVFPVMMMKSPPGRVSMKGSISPEYFKSCVLPSLQLEYCDLDDETLRHMILSCKNLRFLRVVLKDVDNPEVAFGSSKMLRELNVSRKNLETFEIFSHRKLLFNVNEKVSAWKDILEAFFRVFPNIIRFSSGPLETYNTEDIFGYGLPDDIPENDDDKPETAEDFRFGFSRELSTSTDEGSGLAETIACSFFTEADIQRQALRASSALKLTSISLLYWRDSYGARDTDVLMKFFPNQKSLKYANIMFKETIDTELLKTILFQILEQCTDLIELKYCTHMEWLPTLTNEEVSRFCRILDQRKLFIEDRFWSINGSSSLTADRMRTSSFIAEDKFVKVDQRRQFILNFVQRCGDIQHLDIECAGSSPDAMLQTIFRYQPNLKNLSIRFEPVVPTGYRHHEVNTNFGMTGRHGSRPGVQKNHMVLLSNHYANMLNPGQHLKNFNDPYDESQKISPGGLSISRLQSLERLTLVASTFSYMDDTMYYHLVFPNLRYLEFSPPQDQKILLDLATNMPSLEEVYFIWQPYDYKYLVKFCKRLKKLHTLRLRKTSLGSDMSESDIRKAFEVCPTLKIIHGYCSTCAVYDESRKSKIRISGNCDDR